MLGLEMKYFNLKPKGNNVYAHASRVADEGRKAELSKNSS